MSSSLPVGQSIFYVSSEVSAFQNKDFYRGVFEKGELNGLAHIRYSRSFRLAMILGTLMTFVMTVLQRMECLTGLEL